MNRPYASFLRRLGAYVIDSLILSALAFPFFIAFFLSGLALKALDLPAMAGYPWAIVIMLVSLAGGWLYYAMQESSIHQATLGKRALGLYVSGLDGERLTFQRASIRYAGRIVSGLIFNIGYLLALFTARNQALHDLIASTVVLRR